MNRAYQSQHFRSNVSERNSNAQLSQMTSPYGGQKRLTDGTSVKAIEKAMASYLNSTGAGDYDMPKLTGEKISISNKRNPPNWSF